MANAVDLNDAKSLPVQIVLDTMLDGLITIDKHGTIQTFNLAAVRIFQYLPEEVIGKNVKILMPDPYHSEHDQYLKNYLTSHEKKVIGIGRQVSAQKKDGTVFPIELGVNEMEVSGTKMFVGTIRDISERVIADEAKHSYLEQLQRSNQELDDFAYIASHDLKEPLRGLSNNALFLEEDYADQLDESGKKRIQRMRFLCDRMEKLVDDLLYFSRLGRQDLAIQNTDINIIIKDIEIMMETTLIQNNARIIIPKALPNIICDVPRITEVFRNLITNAVKYNDKPNKTVEIGIITPQKTASKLEKHPITFYVKDNGIGIENIFFEDVFRIFKRLNDEEDNIKGTGVGLTFVKKIIERHNGKIWLESELGVGTTFYFTLQQFRTKEQTSE
ncbi:PAS domain-containing sensor histidine kinase [Marinomonas agarivorans]|nr:PAS domain-containing sensor histidine kinase [Marinomonas agarivorans]